MSKSELSARFSATWRAANLSGEGAAHFERLSTVYTPADRTYHNLKHIEHMLSEFDLELAAAEAPKAVEFAIWFHDGIYDSRAKDNEERSAAWAQEVLKNGGADARFCNTVSELILATRH